MKKIVFTALVFMISCVQKPEQNIVKYEIEDFFDNISVYGGYFSSSEERLIFSSNESGIYNVYEVNINDQAVTKLSNSEKESFFVRSYVPNSDSFIYSADKG